MADNNPATKMDFSDSKEITVKEKSPKWGSMKWFTLQIAAIAATVGLLISSRYVRKTNNNTNNKTSDALLASGVVAALGAIFFGAKTSNALGAEREKEVIKQAVDETLAIVKEKEALNNTMTSADTGKKWQHNLDNELARAEQGTSARTFH